MPARLRLPVQVGNAEREDDTWLHILYVRDTDKTAGIGVRTTTYIEATYGAMGITFQTLHTVREGDTLVIVGHGSAKKR